MKKFFKISYKVFLTGLLILVLSYLNPTETKSSFVKGNKVSASEQTVKVAESKKVRQQTPTHPAPKIISKSPAYKVNTIIIAGHVIAYQNGGESQGQAIINSDETGLASTWGGTQTFSGTDGLSTQFIGHNPGAFTPVLSEAVGDLITVTDASAHAFVYRVTEIDNVNPYGYAIGSGTDLYYRITGVDNQEQIVLQTCINNYDRRIVFAEIVH